MEGCPISVSGYFDCHNNKLTTLKGGPKFIRGSFYCSNYGLTSLEGCPECVDGVFDCGNEHAQNTGRNGRPLTTGYDTRKQIRTFEGLKLVGKFECSTTPVCLLWELFKDETKIELFNDFGITDGDVVITERLNEFLEMIGKSKINPSKIRDKRGYRFV